MIRQTLTTDTTIDSDIAFLEAQEEIAQDIAWETYREVEPQFIADISRPAPPVERPIEWTSDKQRIAFFASDGFGKGIPTKRTGALEKAWRMYLITDGDGGFLLVAENTKPYSKFTGGSLAQNLNQALRFQQKFHRNTGHRAYTLIVKQYFDLFNSVFEEKLDERIRAQVNTKRRAYTKGTPRK